MLTGLIKNLENLRGKNKEKRFLVVASTFDNVGSLIIQCQALSETIQICLVQVVW